MATTRLMPLHTGKGRTVGTAISDIIDYVQNPQKTDNGRLITSYQCDSRIADAEFLFNKRQYIAATGRVRGEDDVIAYHLRQSFVPGEITPEEANRLGCELARRFTKGKHAFIVCTHIDRKHIHNHIIFDATALYYQRKFRNFWDSTRAVRRLNDTICIENGYSIVENPKPHGKSYNKWLGDRAKQSQRETLRVMIDQALEQMLNSIKYGPLYSQNYYRIVKEKNRTYYEVYSLPRTETPPEDYTQVSFVCLRPDGAYEAPATVSSVCRYSRKKIGDMDDFHFHLLRHTYTTNLLSHGAAPKDVQELLGHSDVSTTMNIYAHATREAKRTSARLLDKVVGTA